MPQIINLSPIGDVQPGDAIPVFDESNGDARRMSVGQLSTYMEATLSLPDNAADIDYDPAGTGAVQRSVQSKLRDVVSVKDFGAVGDGVTDDTAAIQSALNVATHVIIPAGMTPLVSSSISVPGRTKLEFQGGGGNLAYPATMPGSYLIKKSTMTTPAIIIAERGVVEGGGVLGQAGNTGDGVQLAGNSATLRNHIVCLVGRDGIRVGTDGVYSNCNSTMLEYVKAKNNGRHGFYIHDGVSVGAINANAGSLIQCEANYNGGDGIRLGNCWWVSVINCLTEVNLGYGLYLSGANNDSYPECRWATVVGGDFNEGNNSTVNIDQVYDSSYFSTFINPDVNQFPTNTTTSGLQGAGLRSQFGSHTKTSFYGGSLYTGSANQYPLFIDTGSAGGSFNAVTLKKQTVGNNGEGTGIGWSISPGGASPYVQAAEIKVTQNSVNEYGMTFNVYRSGALSAVEINANAYSFRPRSDNVWGLGQSGLRWSVVYAATGTINTSDEREKQDIADLDAAEKRVAVALKGLVKKFRFKDAVVAKGDAARIHVGLIAQEVVAAFTAEGLDATRYGLLCYDEWDAESDEDGNEIIPAGNRYGVRYEELLSFIIAAL